MECGRRKSITTMFKCQRVTSLGSSAPMEKRLTTSGEDVLRSTFSWFPSGIPISLDQDVLYLIAHDYQKASYKQSNSFPKRWIISQSTKNPNGQSRPKNDQRARPKETRKNIWRSRWRITRKTKTNQKVCKAKPLERNSLGIMISPNRAVHQLQFPKIVKVMWVISDQVE